MIVVYVAGPYRASNAWEIELNVRKAEILALEVWRMGAVAICPHTLSRFYQGAAPDDVWLAGDLELVLRSDCMLLVPGWQSSIGSCGEEYFARRHQKPIFETLEQLRVFLDRVPDIQTEVCARCGATCPAGWCGACHAPTRVPA